MRKGIENMVESLPQDTNTKHEDSGVVKPHVNCTAGSLQGLLHSPKPLLVVRMAAAAR